MFLIRCFLYYLFISIISLQFSIFEVSIKMSKKTIHLHAESGGSRLAAGEVPSSPPLPLRGFAAEVEIFQLGRRAANGSNFRRPIKKPRGSNRGGKAVLPPRQSGFAAAARRSCRRGKSHFPHSFQWREAVLPLLV